MEIDTREEGEKKKKRTRRERGSDNKAYNIEEYPLAEIDPRTAAQYGQPEYPHQGGGTMVLQPVPTRQSAPQPAYMSLQPGGMLFHKPGLSKPSPVKNYHDYLAYNICTCICCCWLTGIVGIFFSLRTRKFNQDGLHGNARNSSTMAMVFALLSLGIGLFLFFVVVLTLAIMG